MTEKNESTECDADNDADNDDTDFPPGKSYFAKVVARPHKYKSMRESNGAGGACASALLHQRQSMIETSSSSRRTPYYDRATAAAAVAANIVLPAKSREFKSCERETNANQVHFSSPSVSEVHTAPTSVPKMQEQLRVLADLVQRALAGQDLGQLAAEYSLTTNRVSAAANTTTTTASTSTSSNNSSSTVAAMATALAANLAAVKEELNSIRQLQQRFSQTLGHSIHSFSNKLTVKE